MQVPIVFPPKSKNPTSSVQLDSRISVFDTPHRKPVGFNTLEVNHVKPIRWTIENPIGELVNHRKHHKSIDHIPPHVSVTLTDPQPQRTKRNPSLSIRRSHPTDEVTLPHYESRRCRGEKSRADGRTVL